MKIKFFDKAGNEIVTDLTDAPFELLVMNHGSKSQAKEFYKAIKSARWRIFRREVNLIEQEILVRYEELKRSANIKFYE